MKTETFFKAKNLFGKIEDLKKQIHWWSDSSNFKSIILYIEDGNQTVQVDHFMLSFEKFKKAALGELKVCLNTLEAEFFLLSDEAQESKTFHFSEAKIPADVTGFYSAPVRYTENGLAIEVCEPEDADFYSVYAKDGYGLSRCLADLEGPVEAEKLVVFLTRNFIKLP